MAGKGCIRVFGARQHNLKNIDVEFPKGALTVVTGLSGSGKSSLAFDTVYAEGQRRYVESLSAYARQFLEQMQKPDVDRIEGLCPTIAIEQRVSSASPRSTVATSTEIYDFLRVLFARVGEPRCWHCDRPIIRQSTAQVVDAVMAGPEGRRILVLAPLVRAQRGKHEAVLGRIAREGFVRARVDGEVRLLDELEPLSPNRKHSIEVVVDRLRLKPGLSQRLADSVELAMRLCDGRVIVAAETGDDRWSDEGYSAALSCPIHTDVQVAVLNPQLFSFNSPHGACEKCHGLGITQEFDTDLVVPDPNLSLTAGAVAAWRHHGKRRSELYARMIREFCERFEVLPDAPFRNLPEHRRRVLLFGTNEVDAKTCGATFEGVIPNLKRLWETSDSEAMKQRLHSFLAEAPCEHCGGTRLRREALCVKIDGRSIADITGMDVAQALNTVEQLRFEGEAAPVAGPLLREVRQRLRFLENVGVGYLALDRASATLSGGEWQRIRLATQIGSGLAGVCYVLDEPTIGLHARDSRRLVDILKGLAALDNTVIVVEHDEEVIAAADHLIDIGPGAGLHGGQLVAQGRLEEVLRSENSVTAGFLTGRKQIALPEKRRDVDWDHCIELRGVTANNLKNVHVRIPLGCFVCVTGVSGSGKSSLITQVLVRVLRRRIDRSGARPGPFERILGSANVDKIIEIDQAPIGRTPRSTPATYVGVFDLIRRLYAQTREAKIRGYGPARFSFNVKGGRCADCEGQGMKRIAMHFLPDVYVECGGCGGQRYNRETLEVRYRGKTIADVLDLRVEEATVFFENFANIHQHLQALKAVGLGYVTLGQSSSTLSGGEAQRVKLASELHKSPDAHTLYVLDEPTTGLHPADVRNLLTVLNRLADQGHTVLVIEHNLDVIKTADWVIDLGPEGGDEGGTIVAEGAPETIAACPESYTGRFLKNRLANRPPLPLPPQPTTAAPRP